MRFESTAKVLLKCKLKYYRISERLSNLVVSHPLEFLATAAVISLTDPKQAQCVLCRSSMLCVQCCDPSQDLWQDLKRGRSRATPLLLPGILKTSPVQGLPSLLAIVQHASMRADQYFHS